MSESETHKRLKKVACAFLKKTCVDVVALETKFRNIRSIADACGINLKKKEIRVIEVKATLQDYKRDKKLFNLTTSYYPHCHYFYIMCPTDVVKKDMVIDGIGLLHVDQCGIITIVKKPTKNTSRLKTMFDTTLKNAVRSITNSLVYKYLRADEETNILNRKGKRKK